MFQKGFMVVKLGTFYYFFVATINKLLSLFTVGSEGYNRINVFLKTFKIANGLNYKLEDVVNKYYSFLVFVYDITLPHK